jgi:mRNA interferase RelE/StbE
LAWQIIFNQKAKSELKKLDASIQRRVIDYLNNKILNLNNPRQLGGALHGKLQGFWKYRIGDYRILTKIDDNILTVLVIKIGHRRDVYK